MLLLQFINRKYLLGLLCFLFNPFVLFGQQSEETNTLISNAQQYIFSDPQQAIKVGEHIIKNSEDNFHKATAAYIKAEAYYFLGEAENYMSAIITSENFIKKLDNNNKESLSLKLDVLYFLIIKLYELGLKQLAEQKTEDLKYLSKKLTDNSLKSKIQIQLELIKVRENLEKERTNEALKALHRLELENAESNFFPEIRFLIGKIYFEKNEVEQAELYFINQTEHTTPVFQIQSKIFLKQTQLQNGDYQNITEELQQLLKNDLIYGNKFLEVMIYQQLAQNYLAIDDKIGFQHSNQRSNFKNSEAQKDITLATNFVLDSIQKSLEKTVAEIETKNERSLFIFTGLLLLLILLYLFLKWYFHTRIVHAKDINNYLKLIKKAEIQSETSIKTTGKPLAIPKETEALILSKIERFESGKKFLQKDMSLAQLATTLDTNTKYLSEIINTYKEKNFNTYINDLRINYIVNELKTNPKFLQYKVSYLAEICGFTSHSSFATVFKNTTGISPNVFIQFLLKDKEQVNKKNENAA